MTKFWKKTPCWWINPMTMYFIFLPLTRLRVFEAALFFIGMLLLVSSCKKPQEIGLDVLPPSEVLQIEFTDTVTINTFTFKEDSIPTSPVTLNLLGRYIDSEFGVVDASFYTQFQLSAENPGFGDLSQVKIDSVILSFVYSGFYGSDDSQSFLVYELEENMSTDSTYYSDRTFTTGGTEIGKIENVAIELFDSITVGGQTQPSQLRIPLYNHVGEQLLSLAANNTNANFLNDFKGVYVMTDTTKNQFAGKGGILYFDLFNSNSKITVYYRTASDTLEFDFLINENSVRVNHFKHNYTTTNVEKVLNGTSDGSVFYVQSMAGLKTKLEIPYFDKLAVDRQLAVSRAEIIVTLDPNSAVTYSSHTRLSLQDIGADGSVFLLPDQFEAGGHFGGNFDLSNQQYVFNVTRYVQQKLNDFEAGINENYGLYLVSTGASVNASRTILQSQKNSAGGGIKLKLSFTEI
ncbi:DUF4270 domain-containing protein [Bacteroidales bacterium AH-315-I05]|nr:DUF4270 domain-containing protein [Bacteroidales bacterium AH-315-I05]